MLLVASSVSVAEGAKGRKKVVRRALMDVHWSRVSLCKLILNPDLIHAHTITMLDFHSGLLTIPVQPRDKLDCDDTSMN
jgi:hypothetical protein